MADRPVASRRPEGIPAEGVDLTPAGAHVRDVAASGRRPWSFVPCAREHEPNRVCILPDGHQPITARVCPDERHHLETLLRAAEDNAYAGGSTRGLTAADTTDVVVEWAEELLADRVGRGGERG